MFKVSKNINLTFYHMETFINTLMYSDGKFIITLITSSGGGTESYEIHKLINSLWKEQ
jgi:hypothetical protein